MIANVIGISFITIWIGLVVFFRYKKHKLAKKTGKPECCCGCSEAKTGCCNCK